jgi:hypothetical protein
LQDADSKRSALEEQGKKLDEREAKVTNREKVSATAFLPHFLLVSVNTLDETAHCICSYAPIIMGGLLFFTFLPLLQMTDLALPCSRRGSRSFLRIIRWSLNPKDGILN